MMCFKKECKSILQFYIISIFTHSLHLLISISLTACAQIVDAIRQSDHYIPSLSLVAFDNENILGHILFSNISIVTEKMEVPAMALVPMTVLPKYQRKGIGTTLVIEGLRECIRLGHRIVVVIGHADYYLRFGFVSATSKHLIAPILVSDEAFMVYEVDDALKDIKGTVKYSEMLYVKWVFPVPQHMQIYTRVF